MIEIVDNLVFMGIAASIIAVLMMLAARVGRGMFSGVWYQTGWIIAMLLLLIPVYWLISSVSIQPEMFEKLPVPSGFRDGYVQFMDRPFAEFFRMLPDKAGISTEESADLTGPTVKTVLFFVWVAGVIVLARWKLIRYYTFRNSIVRRSVPSDERWVFAIPEEIRIKIKMRDAAIPSPFVFGIFRPTVVMPEHAENKEDICFALMHELLHIERKDLLTKTIAECVAVLHWFNPFAWIIRNRVTMACENACDEAVAARLGEDGRKGYAMAILDFMDYSAAPEPEYPPTLMSFSGDSDHVKTRLKNIMKYRQMRRSDKILSVVTILTVMSVGVMTGFVMALSIRSVRADREEIPVPVESVPEAEENGLMVETEPTEPDPAPLIIEPADYSAEVIVFSKGDNTVIAGSNICEKVTGFSAGSVETMRYSTSRKSVAFLSKTGGSDSSDLYYSDGKQALRIAKEVSAFDMSSDGKTVAYRTGTGEERLGSIVLFSPGTGESIATISLAYGDFALSPHGRAIGYAPSADGAVRVFFHESRQTLTPDVSGSILALSDFGDLIYFVREERGKPLLSVMLEGRTVELLRGSDFSADSPQRLILSGDRTEAIVVSADKVISFSEGNKTTLFENTDKIICSPDTVILDRIVFPGGYTLFVEELREDSKDGVPVFTYNENSDQSFGTLVHSSFYGGRVVVPGKVMAFTSDGYRVIYRTEDDKILIMDDIFGTPTDQRIAMLGSISSADQIAFAADRSVYYLNDDGQLNRIGMNGRTDFVAGDVDEFALISNEKQTELFYLADYCEALMEQGDQTSKIYGRSLYAARHELISAARLIDDFVLRMEVGPYGVIYECISQVPYGSSGCTASVDIFYSSNGKDYSNILEIG